MASILRSVVAGPRQRHPEAGLDLCYVTDNIVVTSGPSSTYPTRAYRNPTDALVKWLDGKHGKEWQIWEFRAEGTGYPDSEVYGRVKHYPWPDHHPPPFHLVPAIMASMRNWLHEEGAKGKGRTVVVHCKAGKGRSGTIASSYLISQEGWTVEDALNRFTQRRMRPGFGAGVSIPSQVRWVGYVDLWTKGNKRYLERKAIVKEVHVWGLREGVKVSVEGFIEDGKKIANAHTFDKSERLLVDSSAHTGSFLHDLTEPSKAQTEPSDILEKRDSNLIDTSTTVPEPTQTDKAGDESGGKTVIFRAKEPIRLETSDICIDFERRNRAKYGWTMVTSVAHVWFNVFFEGLAHDATRDAMHPPSSGIFNIEWDAMDGIKGTSRKGIRSFDRLAVVWEAVDEAGGKRAELVVEPAMGEPVPESEATNWRGQEDATPGARYKDIGLREESPTSANISKANSVRSADKTGSHHEHSSDTQSGNDDAIFQSFQSDAAGEKRGVGDADRDQDIGDIETNDGKKAASVVEKVHAAVGYVAEKV